PHAVSSDLDARCDGGCRVPSEGARTRWLETSQRVGQRLLGPPLQLRGVREVAQCRCTSGDGSHRGGACACAEEEAMTLVQLGTPGGPYVPSADDPPFLRLGGPDGVRALVEAFYDAMERHEPELTAV